MELQATCKDGCRVDGLDPRRPRCGAHGQLFVRAADRGHDRAPHLGRTLDGRYHLVGVLGVGGFGTVYLAIQDDLARLVAVKVLQTERAEKASIRRRFRQEARSLAQLQSDHIVAVHHAGGGFVRDGAGAQAGSGRRVLYFVTEYLRGPTLAQTIQRAGPMRPAAALAIGRQVLSALGTAHAADVVHRDLKPSNVMLVPSERGAPRVKVLDFGLAAILGGDSHSTSDGTLLGTARYMAPEQLSGQRATPASDLFSVGAMLYELLEGRPLFDAPSTQALLASRMAAGPVVLPEGWPPTLAAVLRRTLSLDPAARFRRAEDLAAALGALEEVLANEPVLRVVERQPSAPAPAALPPRAADASSVLPAPAPPPSEASDDSGPLVDDSGPVEPSTEDIPPPFRPSESVLDPFAPSAPARPATRPLPAELNQSQSRPAPPTPRREAASVRPSLLLLFGCVLFGWLLGTLGDLGEAPTPQRRVAATPASKPASDAPAAQAPAPAPRPVVVAPDAAPAPDAGPEPDAAPAPDAAPEPETLEMPVVLVPDPPSAPSCDGLRAAYRESLADHTGMGLRGQREALRACAECVGTDSDDPCARQWHRMQQCVYVGVRIKGRAERGGDLDALARQADRCRFWCRDAPMADDHWDTVCSAVSACAKAVHRGVRGPRCTRACAGAPAGLARLCK